ncbi:MAG: SxtJ family membrane protein [Planctomycetota bacterium]
MNLIRIDPNPSRRQLFVFGACWLFFMGIVGDLVLRRGGSLTTATILWCAAAAVPLVGWVFPKLMRVLYLGAAYLTLPVGFVVSYLILGVVYYFVFTPVGLLMRLFGYDPLNRGFDSNRESYWVPRKIQSDLKRYLRQF